MVWRAWTSPTSRGILTGRVRWGLKCDIAEDTGENLGRRLWRRYGCYAEEMLDLISADMTVGWRIRQSAAPVSGAVKIEHLREREMIVNLEDLLRRRSRLALLYRKEELRHLPGLREMPVANCSARKPNPGLTSYFRTSGNSPK